MLVCGRGGSPQFTLLKTIEMVLINANLILLHKGLTEDLVIHDAVFIKRVRAGHYLYVILSLVPSTDRSQTFDFATACDVSVSTVLGNLRKVRGG